MSESLDPYRLPRTVLPTRYKLTVEPDLQTARFSGGVNVAVEVVEPVQVVWLNAADLAITAAVMEDAAGQQRPCGPRSLPHEAPEARAAGPRRSRAPPGLRVKDVSEVHRAIAPAGVPAVSYKNIFCSILHTRLRIRCRVRYALFLLLKNNLS